MTGENGKGAAATKAPRIVRTVAELQRLADAERAARRRIALVPTMGALHAGHLALVRAARARADRVWVSIFVNPTQFGPHEDFSRYPRPFDQDVALCGEAGVDVVFAPSAEEMYPPGAQTTVEVSELAKPLCGASRPGHFRGVATVVTKLLAAAKPHVAVFGEKDFQQLALVRRLVRDLLLDVEIVGVETARARDGLALSSRNTRLAPEVRQDALSLVRALEAAELAVAGGRIRPMSCCASCAAYSCKPRVPSSTTPNCATQGRSKRRRRAFARRRCSPSPPASPPREASQTRGCVSSTTVCFIRSLDRRNGRDPNHAQVEDPPRHRDRGQSRV